MIAGLPIPKLSAFPPPLWGRVREGGGQWWRLGEKIVVVTRHRAIAALRVGDQRTAAARAQSGAKLDRLVFEAYGWPQTLSDEEILERLVALNHERAAEERRGHVRWLRPDYQIPRFGKDVDKMAAKEEGAQIAADLGLPEPGARKPSFPTDAVAQTAAVFSALSAARGPITVGDLAAGFRRSKNLEKNIRAVLDSLARLGHLNTRDGKSFEIRRVA
jgi:hypothetical protein